MSDEHEKIERMVQQGRLTRSEADELLAALEPEEAGQQRPAAHEEHHSARRTFRIHVDEAGGEKVDLGFPMALAGVGLNILARRGKATIDVSTDPMIVLARSLEADAQAVLTSSGTLKPDLRIAAFRLAMSAASINL